MAYVRAGVGGLTEVMVAGPDGSGARVLASRRAPELFWTSVDFGGGYFAPAWSPDGAILVVLGQAGNDRGQVVLLDTGSGAERAVEFGQGTSAVAMSWLDGSTLLLSAMERPGSEPMQLWLLSHPQGAFHRLTNDLVHYLGVSLTADGRECVTQRAEAWFSIWTSDAAAARWTETVSRTPVKGPIGFGVRWLGDDLVFPSGASGGFTLERWSASTGTTEALARAGGAAQVSRDGSTVVYWDFDRFQLWKLDVDGRSKTLLEGGAWNDRITPDGRQIVGVETPLGGRPAVRIRTIDGASAAREVTADRVRPGRVLVSPDSRWIVYPSFDDKDQPAVAVCDLATCSSPRIFPAMGQQWTPDGQRWTPDSRGLAYVDPRTPSEIWIQPLDGGAPRRLAHLVEDGSRIIDFDWTPDGRRLAVARYWRSNNIVLFRGLKRPAP
jgi:Tol biopolymer transport system component